jgi:hypothetical protein
MKYAVLLVLSACTDSVVVPSDDTFYALYTAAPASAATLPATIDTKACTYQRFLFGSGPDRPFVLVHPSDAGCEVWIGLERAMGLRTRQHEYCVLDRDIAIEARSDRELFVDAPRCALDFDELDYEAPRSFAATTPIAIDLDACAYGAVDTGEAGLGGPFVLVHRSYDDHRCELWTGYADDVRYDRLEHCVVDAAGATTASLNSNLRLSVSACQ